jgi:hypothetical protein
MRLKRHRWTIGVVALWLVLLGLTTVVAPPPVDASVQQIGWMVYTPNHPNGCAPMPYDCYAVWVFADE